MTKLTLIRGIPGSGKTSLAYVLQQDRRTTSLHFEADQFFMKNGEYLFDRTRLREAHEYCQDQTRLHLSRGFHVIVSNTFTTLKEMKPYFQMIHEYGKQPAVYVCQSNWGNEHGVPDDVLQAMTERFQYDLTSLYGLLQDKAV